VSLGPRLRHLQGRAWSPFSTPRDSTLKLRSGNRIGVIGGGPAGSFFSYFLLDMAGRIDLELEVDVYEPRDFSRPGPASCNMCGGIISESLVQTLAVEGIKLPPTVVQRGVDSYCLHMDVGNVLIETPLHEKRIGAIHRGAGPRGATEVKWQSFDGYLLEMAKARGAHILRTRVERISWDNGRPQVKAHNEPPRTYDLLTVAVGVNSGTLKLFAGLGLNYHPPKTTKTYICEFRLGQSLVKRYLGSSMHVFLLDVPRLEFAALIPKGDYVTVCLLGEEIDKPLVNTFLTSRQVQHCMPPHWKIPDDFCHCSPSISISGAYPPFADRVVFIGDCGVTRLYKDGIGAAYRTAKTAAKTALFEGISAEDFRLYYWPVCRWLWNDNRVGKLIFFATRCIQKLRFARKAVLHMVSREQHEQGIRRRMSLVLWDTFTGSAPYREVFWRTLNPVFLLRLLGNLLAAMKPAKAPAR